MGIDKKYLLALKEGENLYGLDITSWDDSVEAFKVSSTASVTGYEDISSIENWYQFENDIRISYKQIYILFNETTWEELNENEKKIVCLFHLVDDTKKNSYLTEKEKEKYNYYKIYNYTTDDSIENVRDYKIPPHGLNYKTGVSTRLHPDYEFNELGFLVKCTYYSDMSSYLDSNGFTQFEFENPILEYTADYELHDNGYAKKRIVERKWYKMDGSISDETKLSEKYYTGITARDEGKRRRRNLINGVLVDTVGLFIMTEETLSTVIEAETHAIPFMKEVAPGISDYYEYGNRKDSMDNPCLLIQIVTDSTYSLLDNYVPGTYDTVTIRNFIISRLDV